MEKEITIEIGRHGNVKDVSELMSKVLEDIKEWSSVNVFIDSGSDKTFIKITGNKP